MGERPTLILTTRLGVRPLGVRGDPLHAVAGQLLSVIRRRLGDGPADLLADPQLRESDDGIDWYAARSGEVRRLAELGEGERAEALRTVEIHLAAIRALGAQLQASDASEEARLIGRSLELATAPPVRRLHLSWSMASRSSSPGATKPTPPRASQTFASPPVPMAARPVATVSRACPRSPCRPVSAGRVG